VKRRADRQVQIAEQSTMASCVDWHGSVVSDVRERILDSCKSSAMDLMLGRMQ